MAGEAGNMLTLQGVWGMSGWRILEHLKIAGKSELESPREIGTELF